MNNCAFVEIYGFLSNDIVIQSNSDGLLFGLIQLQMGNENNTLYVISGKLDVLLYGMELISKFAPLLKKGVKVSIVGELESTRVDLVSSDIQNMHSPYFNPVIKIYDPKRINILPKEPIYSKTEKKMCKIKYQKNYQIGLISSFSNNGLQDNIWI
jgi:hypothetical protein